MLNKKGTTITARIGLTMGFLAVLLIAIGVLGLVGMGQADDAYRDVFTNQMPSAVDIGNFELFVARERLALDRAALEGGTSEVAATVERARGFRTIAAMWWKKYIDLPRNAEEDRLAQDVAAKRDAEFQAADTYGAAISAKDSARLVDDAKRTQATDGELITAGEALSNYLFTQGQAGFDRTQHTYQTFRIVTFIALALGLLAAVMSYVTLRGAIARPLADALSHFASIAAGDLRRPVVIRSQDEMGQLLEGVEKMRGSLIDTVRAVRAGSESIATATQQIAAGNTDLSSRTEEQAAALQQTASSMEQLTGAVKQNADNARQATTLATNASDIATKGSVVVSQVVGTMGEINQSSTKIADIISIIEGIAFQTNILALNAAVEAARAGEEGRGFAVVAGEVRSLAQRASAAAKEIKALIDTSVRRVQSGTALVDEAGRTMTNIIDAVQRVTDIMGGIAAASEEQRSGIDQVARAVTQMDEVTQQNAALVEEAAAAASSLEDQAGKLRTTVAVFQLEERAAAPAFQALRQTGPTPPKATRALARPAVKASMQAAKSAMPAIPAIADASNLVQPATRQRPAPAATVAVNAGSDKDWETF